MALQNAVRLYNTIVKNPEGEYYYDYKAAYDLFDIIEKTTNDKVAQYYLAECYYYGRGISKNLNRYIHYANKSSDQDYSQALCLISKMIEKKEYFAENTNNDYTNLMASLNTRAIEVDRNKKI